MTEGISLLVAALAAVLVGVAHAWACRLERLAEIEAENECWCRAEAIRAALEEGKPR